MALNRLLLNREVNNDYIELHINCELFGHSTLHNEQIMMAVYYTVYRLCNAYIFMQIHCTATATATKYLCFTLTGPMNPTFLLYMNNFDSKKVHFRYIESVLVMDFGCTAHKFREIKKTYLYFVAVVVPYSVDAEETSLSQVPINDLVLAGQAYFLKDREKR